VALEVQSLGVGIAFGLLTAIGLTALFESLQVLEDPFTAYLALDGIDVREEFEVLLWSSLVNTRKLIFPDAPPYPVCRRAALTALTSENHQSTHFAPRMPSPPPQKHQQQQSTPEDPEEDEADDDDFSTTRPPKSSSSHHKERTFSGSLSPRRDRTHIELNGMLTSLSETNLLLDGNLPPPEHIEFGLPLEENSAMGEINRVRESGFTEAGAPLALKHRRAHSSDIMGLMWTSE
jgi:hypothetical protein